MIPICVPGGQPEAWQLGKHLMSLDCTLNSEFQGASHTHYRYHTVHRTVGTSLLGGSTNLSYTHTELFPPKHLSHTHTRFLVNITHRHTYLFPPNHTHSCFFLNTTHTHTLSTQSHHTVPMCSLTLSAALQLHRTHSTSSILPDFPSLTHMPPLTHKYLNPGEKSQANSPTRPMLN